MAERESDQAIRDRQDAEKAAENRERQYRQGVVERPKAKPKAKKEEKEESEA